MLAPDINSTQACMQDSGNAAQAVTQYAQAITTLVPAYYSALTGSWESLQSTLQAMVNHAQTWPDSLCASYTQDIPQLFISYNNIFQQQLNDLLQQEKTLMADPNNISAQYALTNGLKVLLDGLETLSPPLSALQPNVVTFENLLQADHTTIDQLVGQLESTVPGAGTVVKNVQSTLNISFFSSNMLGPCNAIVEMNSSVTVQLQTALQTAPAVVPVVLLQSLLQQIEPQNELATRSLTDILQIWATLTVKLENVILQIQQAEAEQLGNILQQLDLQQAGLAWQQLATFAQTLVQTLSEAKETHYA